MAKERKREKAARKTVEGCGANPENARGGQSPSPERLPTLPAPRQPQPAHFPPPTSSRCSLDPSLSSQTPSTRSSGRCPLPLSILSASILTPRGGSSLAILAPPASIPGRPALLLSFATTQEDSPSLEARGVGLSFTKPRKSQVDAAATAVDRGPLPFGPGVRFPGDRWFSGVQLHTVFSRLDQPRSPRSSTPTRASSLLGVSLPPS